MESQLEKIRDVQKEAWNKSSPGWKKWDNMMMEFLKPMSNEIIRMLHLKDDHVILDVATGTGEPGLTIASMMNNGKVIATDIAEGMLSVADENAVRLGIDNFETVCCDVSELPFDDNTFNGISCRLGFMFFPDMQLALREMTRVLKPGGRIVSSVWNMSENNFWISASMETMISMLQLKPPSSGGPGLFRCAQPGFMKELLTEAGLKNIEQKEVNGKLPCDTLETYWNFITDVACPMAFSKADEESKKMIKEEVLRKVHQKYPVGNISPESNAIVICGEK